MTYYQGTKMMAVTALALAVVLSGCSKKPDDASAQGSASDQTAQGDQQSAQPQSGQQQAKGKRAEGAKGQGWGDQGKGSGQAYTSDRYANQQAAPQVHNYTLDAGSAVVVRTINALSTKTNKVGDKFEATLEQPLVAGDYTIAPKGTTVFGEVSECDPSGKLKGHATLGVRLTAIAMPNGDRIGIQTKSDERVSQGTGKKTAAKVGIGAGIGALIGGLAGGGKGAAIGAASGGALGGGVAYATGGNPAVIPSETVLSFQLAAPVTVTTRN